MSCDVTARRTNDSTMMMRAYDVRHTSAAGMSVSEPRNSAVCSGAERLEKASAAWRRSARSITSAMTGILPQGSGSRGAVVGHGDEQFHAAGVDAREQALAHRLHQHDADARPDAHAPQHREVLAARWGDAGQPVAAGVEGDHGQ